jgi:hypothetical protein
MTERQAVPAVASHSDQKPLDPANYANAADLNRAIGVTGYMERDEAIRDIHKFADWLTAHPEAPFPNVIYATYQVTEQDEADEATRVAGVLAAMKRLQIRPYEGERVVQGDLSIMWSQRRQIVYRLSAHKNQDAGRYLPARDDV